jgi:hypothetical protein
VRALLVAVALLLAAPAAAPAAGISVFVGSATIPVTLDPEQANIWVDDDDGTCFRSATHIDYVDASACGSISEAWQAATNGDLIYVMPKTGGYTGSGNDLGSRGGQGSPMTTIEVAPDTTVRLIEASISGANWLTLSGFEIVNDQSITSTNNQVLDITSSDEIVVEDIYLNANIGSYEGGTRRVRDGIGINGNVDDLLISDSTLIGSVAPLANGAEDAGGKGIIIQDSAGTTGPNSDVRIIHNRIGEQTQGDGLDHMECLWIASVTPFTLSRNHFHDCTLNAINGTFGQTAEPDNYTFENNVFEVADAGVGGIPPTFDGINSNRNNWDFRFNYFGVAIFSHQGSTGTGSELTGNIGVHGNGLGCWSGATYTYNRWSDMDCSSGGSGDVQDANAANSTTYYTAPKAGEALGPGDYSPASGSAPQINAGGPTCPLVDIDGNPRPFGAACDAGPYERQE